MSPSIPVGTIALNREHLDHVLVLIERHIERVLAERTRHFNAERPHQSLGQKVAAGYTTPIAERLEAANTRR